MPDIARRFFCFPSARHRFPTAARPHIGTPIALGSYGGPLFSPRKRAFRKGDRLWPFRVLLLNQPMWELSHSSSACSAWRSTGGRPRPEQTAAHLGTCVFPWTVHPESCVQPSAVRWRRRRPPLPHQRPGPHRLMANQRRPAQIKARIRLTILGTSVSGVRARANPLTRVQVVCSMPDRATTLENRYLRECPEFNPQA